MRNGKFKTNTEICYVICKCDVMSFRIPIRPDQPIYEYLGHNVEDCKGKGKSHPPEHDTWGSERKCRYSSTHSWIRHQRCVGLSTSLPGRFTRRKEPWYRWWGRLTAVKEKISCLHLSSNPAKNVYTIQAIFFCVVTPRVLQKMNIIISNKLRVIHNILLLITLS
jgi:hypothetical protein